MRFIPRVAISMISETSEKNQMKWDVKYSHTEIFEILLDHNQLQMKKDVPQAQLKILGCSTSPYWFQCNLPKSKCLILLLSGTGFYYLTTLQFAHTLQKGVCFTKDLNLVNSKRCSCLLVVLKERFSEQVTMTLHYVFLKLLKNIWGKVIENSHPDQGSKGLGFSVEKDLRSSAQGQWRVYMCRCAYYSG